MRRADAAGETVIAASRLSRRSSSVLRSPAAMNLSGLLKPTVFLLASGPLCWMLWCLFTGRLGPNPVDTLTDMTGTTAIRLLVAGLALTPLRWLSKQTWPLRLRRMLGLFAFFYASLHVCVYLLLDQQLDLAAIWEDLAERPYIMAGSLAFVILLPLAATSTQAMVRRLGGRRWTALHRGIYLAGAAAVVHYVWLAKGDLLEPLVYLGIVLLLYSYRFARLLRRP